MLVAGLSRTAAKAGVRINESFNNAHANHHLALPVPHSLTSRRLFTTVAAQRRPFDRNLLDNVDSSVPDGYSSYSSPAYVPSADTFQTSSTELLSTIPTGDVGPATQPATACQEASTTLEDWPHDLETLALPQSFHQQPEQQPPTSLPLSDSTPYAEVRYSYGAAPPQYPTGSAHAPTSWGSPIPEPPLNTAPASTTAAQHDAEQSQKPPQALPSANGHPNAAADWGEAEPITDWGGVVYGESSGWEEMQGNDDFTPSASQSSSSQETVGGGSSWSTRGGYSRGSSADPNGGPTVEAWTSQSSASAPGVGSGGSWAPPNTSYGGWSETRFTQDERYGARTAAEAGPAGASGMAGGASPSPFQDALRSSDIVLIPGRDASAVLPLAPMSTQVDFFQPRTIQERVVQFIGSIGASVVLSKAAVLAAPALLYPIWSPWIRAGFRNLDLYSKSFSCVGLWRAQVLDVAINGLAIGGIMLSKQPPVVAMLVGDPWVGGARVALELPYQLRSETIRVGDSVELLVLGRDERFSALKVVREVYLPQSGLWLCEYPYVNRDLFVALSVGVERQRRAEAAAAVAALQYDT